MLTKAARIYNTGRILSLVMRNSRYAFNTLPRIKEDQSRNVRLIAAYAYGYVPFYTDTMNRLGLRPHDFQSVDDLKKLPVIERVDVQKDPEYFVSTEKPVDEYHKNITGGSTGAPLEVYNDSGALMDTFAHSERGRSIVSRLLDRRYGYRVTFISPPGCNALRMMNFRNRRMKIPSLLRPEQQNLSLYDPPERNIELINRFRPDLIYSYGSYLSLIFAYLQKNDMRFHRPVAAVYSADGIQPGMRNLIMQDYGIPLFSWYQAIEGFKIAFECEKHMGMHINMDLYPVRIVDIEGNDVPDGETGEVVLSNLVNRGTVLLNYRLGDIASIMAGPCSCGRSLPLLSFIPGRTSDLITLPDGRRIHPQRVSMIIGWDRSVLQYQIEQDSMNHLTVRLIETAGSDRDQTAKQIEKGFFEAFGKDMRITVEFVDSLDTTEGGKHRVVISRMKRAP